MIELLHNHFSMTLEDKINAHFTRLIGGVVYQTERLFLTVVKPNTILSIFLGFGIAICIKIVLF